MTFRNLLLAIVLVVTSLGLACSEEEGGGGPGLSPNPNNRVSDAGTDADAATDVGDDAADTDPSDADDTSDTGDAGDVEPDVCEPNDEQVCTQAGFECGAHDLVDNCGDSRTINCGDEATECSEYETCGGGGNEGVCGCTPTTCEEAGVLCGEVADGCGGTLSCTTFCVDELFSDYKHSCAIGSGKLKCWGAGRNGRLGIGSTSNAQNPTDVQGISGDVVDAAIGERHSCAVTSGGAILCWGDNNVGQLGDGSQVSTETAVSTSVTADATQVVTGVNHTCALIDGGVKCWGSHQYGQIGDPALDLTSTVGFPRQVPGLESGVTQLTAGSFHTCAIMDTGSVKCWGRNDYGQLGSGLDQYTLADDDNTVVYGHVGSSAGAWSIEAPAAVPGYGEPALTDIVEIYAGRGYTCALNSSDELLCWGAIIGRGSCGNRAESSCPYFPDVDGSEGWPIAEIRVNNNDEFENDGWKTRRGAVLPTAVGSSFSIESMAAGANHMCLLVDEPDTTATNVYCLGHNEYGQLGDGSTNGWTDPTELAVDVDGDIVRATQLVAGESHSCALVGDNNAKCWGSNDSGQIGNSDLQREQSYQAFDVKLNTN